MSELRELTVSELDLIAGGDYNAAAIYQTQYVDQDNSARVYGSYNTFPQVNVNQQAAAIAQDYSTAYNTQSVDVDVYGAYSRS